MLSVASSKPQPWKLKIHFSFHLFVLDVVDVLPQTHLKKLQLRYFSRIFFTYFYRRKFPLFSQIQPSSFIPSHATETLESIPYLAVLSFVECIDLPLLNITTNFLSQPQIQTGTPANPRATLIRETCRLIHTCFSAPPDSTCPQSPPQFNRRKSVVVYLSCLITDHKELLQISFLNSSHYLSLQH